MNQYNKVILCKSLKITQYKKFSDAQQKKVCQNTTNTSKQKTLHLIMIRYLQWFRVIIFFKDWPKLPQVLQYIIMRDSLNFKNCDALYEIDCSILYFVFRE